VLTETHVDVLCNGGTTGSINLSVSGGTGTYTYAWSNGAVTEGLSGLVAGTYTVTVTDASGCTAQLPVTVNQAPSLVLTETHVDVLCNGGTTGSINLSVSGGTGTYTYAWSNG